MRQVRYAQSPVGRIPTQIDYADDRDVSGIKMPFRWTVIWLDGQDTVQLNESGRTSPLTPPGSPNRRQRQRADSVVSRNSIDALAKVLVDVRPDRRRVPSTVLCSSVAERGNPNRLSLAP